MTRSYLCVGAVVVCLRRLITIATLQLVKKVRNMETSWALGAAYHLLNTYHEQHPLTIGTGRHTFTRILHSLLHNATLDYVCSTFYQGVNNMLSYFQLLA